MLLLPICLWVKIVEVNLIYLIGEDRLIPERFLWPQLLRNGSEMEKEWQRSLTQGAVWMQVSRQRSAPRQGGKPRWTEQRLASVLKTLHIFHWLSIHKPDQGGMLAKYIFTPEWWASLSRRGFCTGAYPRPSPSSNLQIWSLRLWIWVFRTNFGFA